MIVGFYTRFETIAIDWLNNEWTCDITSSYFDCQNPFAGILSIARELNVALIAIFVNLST